MPGSTSSSMADLSILNMDPVASVDHVNNCAFSSWYDNYKKLTPKTRIIKPLPKEFIDYLLEDGITLPRDDAGLLWEDSEGQEHGRSFQDDSDSEDEEDRTEDPTDHFISLHKEIIHLIQELGGAVCPKLNWSAPKDALWISTTNNLKCVSPSDIYMLLKASSYITHDLTESYDGCKDYQNDSSTKLKQSEDNSNDSIPFHFELVLRKWFDINPALEFRCFVKDRHIVGITQRDMNYYDFLSPLKDKLEEEIHVFFEENLEFSFEDPCFVFDVYVPEPYDRVWLIDINPWASKTDTLLYSWEQLLDYDALSVGFEPELRLVGKVDSSRGFGTVEHSESYVPKDFVDSGLNASSMSDMVERLREMMNNQESSDEE